MIQKFGAEELEALIYDVLKKFFSNPAFGTTSLYIFLFYISTLFYISAPYQNWNFTA